MMKLDEVSNMIFSDFFRLKSKEKVLIIMDENKKKIAHSLFDSSRKICDESVLIEIPVGRVNGEEPPKDIAKLMKNFDVIIAPTTKSISHTKARVNACKAGARMATMPGITEDIFKRAIPVDYEEMKKITLKLKKLMDKTNDVRITTDKGTNIKLSIKGRKSIPDYGDISKKGSFDNLPSGECFIAPIENSADGAFVVDASMGTGKLKEPIRIIFEKGMAVRFLGKEAGKVKSLFKGMPKKAFTIAELGIGTNPKAKISGKTLEDEKVRGTFHIALGNNIGFGGKTSVPIHIDGVVTKPTIWFDNKIIMKRGKLLI